MGSRVALFRRKALWLRASKHETSLILLPLGRLETSKTLHGAQSL